MNLCLRILVLFTPLLFLACGHSGDSKKWKNQVRNELAHLGVRNWVVVAEAGFPVHNRAGLRVISIDDEIPDLVDGIEQIIEEKHHVRPRIYVTSEISGVEYDYAPSVSAYRKDLKEALHGRETIALQNNMLMRMLQDTNKSYRVLLIKSNTAIPYSTVFIELESGYWDSESESVLRRKLEQNN